MNIKYISLKDSLTLFPESNMVIINSHSRSRKKCTVDKNQLFHTTKDSTIGGVFCSMCQLRHIKHGQPNYYAYFYLKG